MDTRFFGLMGQLLEEFLQELHNSPVVAVLAISGGGAKAVTWLLGTPGASRTILEIRIPYSKPALVGYLGYEPREFVSNKTAKDIAQIAYEQAVSLTPLREGLVVGVGCTATLATDRIKKGEHRCFVAFSSRHEAGEFGVTFNKGFRSRIEEDLIVSKLILKGLAQVGGLSFDIPLGLEESEKLVWRK